MVVNKSDAILSENLLNSVAKYIFDLWQLECQRTTQANEVSPELEAWVRGERFAHLTKLYDIDALLVVVRSLEQRGMFPK